MKISVSGWWKGMTDSPAPYPARAEVLGSNSWTVSILPFPLPFIFFKWIYNLETRLVAG